MHTISTRADLSTWLAKTHPEIRANYGDEVAEYVIDSIAGGGAPGWGEDWGDYLARYPIPAARARGNGWRIEVEKRASVAAALYAANFPGARVADDWALMAYGTELLAKDWPAEAWPLYRDTLYREVERLGGLEHWKNARPAPEARTDGENADDADERPSGAAG